MKSKWLRLVLLVLGFSWGGTGFPGSLPAAERVPQIDVILWFDTEDYLLPASDDAAKRVADMLTKRNIRATFKVVGEKARTLERRGRHDVIAALKKHDIGFHSDFHSVHPTPSEYLADSGFLDGVAEFARREGDGAADVRRILGVPTLACYGQPGSSWAAQAVAALKQIGVAPSGVPCYVDEGTHIGLNQKPFWYAGALNVYHLGANYTRMELHNPAAVEPAKKKVSAISDRLARQDGGGLISIFYHPCEWVHREFWDGVNFARGRNPPREEWKAPPQRSVEETEAAFERFGEYIDHIRAIPGARFVTASDLPTIYSDSVRADGATERELDELAKRIRNVTTNALNFQLVGEKAFSVADQFELLTFAVSELSTGKKLKLPSITRGLFGPDHPPSTSEDERPVGWPAFRDAVLDTREFIQTQQRVPANVFIGAESVSPADFLMGLASAYEHARQSGKLPEQVILGRNVILLPERQVAEDMPGLFGGWVIHKADFRAPKILQVARLQTWTLKPAIRHDNNAKPSRSLNQ
jgi:hypothetical protein